MTVVPFERPSRGWTVLGADQSAETPVVTGWFRSPDGRRGHFVGTYRLERIARENGRLTASGVFSGTLDDASGLQLGIGSRRTTVVAELDGNRIRVGPLDVNILGIVVSVTEVVVPLAGAELTDLSDRAAAAPPRPAPQR